MDMFDLGHTRNALGLKRLYKQRKPEHPNPNDSKDSEDLFYDPMIDVENELFRLKTRSALMNQNKCKDARLKGENHCKRCFRGLGESIDSRTVEVAGKPREVREVLANASLSIVFGSRVDHQFDLRRHGDVEQGYKNIVSFCPLPGQNGVSSKWLQRQQRQKTDSKLRVFDDHWDAKIPQTYSNQPEWRLKKQGKVKKWKFTNAVNQTDNQKEINFKIECIECKEFVGIYNFQTDKCLLF